MADLFAKSAQSPYEFAALHDSEDAYDNRSHITDAQGYIDNWPSRAASFADNHGPATQNNAWHETLMVCLVQAPRFDETIVPIS